MTFACNITKQNTTFLSLSWYNTTMKQNVDLFVLFVLCNSPFQAPLASLAAPFVLAMEDQRFWCHHGALFSGKNLAAFSHSHDCRCANLLGCLSAKSIYGRNIMRASNCDRNGCDRVLGSARIHVELAPPQTDWMTNECPSNADSPV
jgi:hypothetical protein